MKVSDEVWSQYADFSAQLRQVMDARRLSIADVARAMRQQGYDTTTKQVHRLYRGDVDPVTGERKRVNPTWITVAVLASVCDVDVRFFFERDPKILAELLGEHENLTARKGPH